MMSGLIDAPSKAYFGARFDALVHLEDPRLGNADGALRAAKEAGVTRMLHAGVDPEVLAPRFAHEGVQILWAPGLHPRIVDPARLDAQLEALARAAVGADAVGEIGIDLRVNMPPRGAQRRALAGALAIAHRRALPFVLHVVRAWPEVLDVVAEAGGAPHGGVLHGFAGPREALPKALDLGLFVSVGGLVLQPRARRLHEALRYIPTDRLLVETDAPDLPLTALPRVIEAIAAARGVPGGDLARQTAENAALVYRAGAPPGHR